MTPTRELELVELVSEAGRALGAATVAQAHTAPGLLHRAFSVLIFDEDGRLLLQQRASTKTRFPSRWANTCCGHPGPAEAPVAAAARRMADELGIGGPELVEAGIYTYSATDPVTGRVEREYDHVLIGRARHTLAMRPDPTEVAATRWTSPTVVEEAAASAPDRYAPWLLGVLRVAFIRLTDMPGNP